jgi:hypothetical protein
MNGRHLVLYTVGALCILLGVIFLVRHMIKPRFVWINILMCRNLCDLSWNQPVDKN